MYNLITIKFYTKPYSIFFLQRNGTYFLNKTRISEDITVRQSESLLQHKNVSSVVRAVAL